MGSLAQAIYDFDKQVFAWIREHLGGGILDEVLVYVGNLYFWTPLIIFMMVLLYRSAARGRALNILYSLGAIVLAYQSGFLLSFLFQQPAPYVVELILRDIRLPGFQNVTAYSFPDWPTAALTALIAFSRFRVRLSGGYFPAGMMVAVLVMGFCRVHAGNAYPYDILGGWVLGHGVAWILRLFSRNLDLIINPDAATAAAPDEVKAEDAKSSDEQQG